ncbi:beta strand repeat-containing protein [Edaphobacter aggregans]|uniref:beta strand repeat-containing protein n=1 Tax=Edaphobacter aggregans TaxID=570835 RepID=UPI002481404D|nr:Ig-like domain repeat protein [Edaphobacter aggregans]
MVVPSEPNTVRTHNNRSRRGWLTSFALVLLLSRVASAQSHTVTTLTATATGAVSGSIVTMTANVSSAGQPVPGGTVTFRDTFAGAAQDLGTAQVQSANGTPGLAILKTEVGGVGAHSIVAIYNAPKAYSTSSSAPAALTFQAPYSSATALAITGSGGTYTLTGTLSAFGPIQPTGSLTFTDTTTNTAIGTVPLDPTTATQGFTPPTLYKIATETPWSTSSMGTPVSGDFNGDGHPDFAVPTSLGPVVVMLGHGDGTFQPGASISATQPFGAIAADLNGDGILDLAIGNRGTNASIAIYLGNGDGTFTAGAVYNAPPNADYQVVGSADFNQDGIPDLVVSDHANNQMAVYLGNGDGTFRGTGLFPTAPAPWNHAIGDINGDGNPDLVIADDINDAQGQNITILLGNGDGTFRQGTYLVGGVTSSGSVALADFNGDGKLDIAATEEPANSVFVFLGNGDGTFQAKTTYVMDPMYPCTTPAACGPYHISLGDFNQDGKKDIITANAEGESISVLLGNSDGTFQAAKMYPAGAAVIYADVQDFNGDNQVDVVAVAQNGLQVYLAGNAETAQFSPFTVTGCGTHSIVATYSSDSNYAASTSPVQGVSQNGVATAISLVQTPPNAVYGQTVTLTATLTPYVNGSNSSDGLSVTFFDGTTSLGTGVLSGGVASLTLTSLTTAPHSFTAVFAGDCALTGSTSVAVLGTVGKATPTITWANPAPIAYGTALSSTQLNATASVPGTFTYSPAAGTIPAAGTDTLSVTFTPTDTVNYAATTSTVTITVGQGTLTVTANDATRHYGAPNPTFTGTVTGASSGDTFTESFTTSATTTSAPGSYAIVPSVTGTNLASYTQSVTNGTLTITQASSTLSIVPSATAAVPGQNVTLTATVTPETSGTPTGTVSLFDNGNPLGTATLTNGTATYSTATLPLGTHAITASYSGDVNFTAATASAVSITIASNVLSVTAADAARVYGTPNPTFTGSITGAQNGDTFTESFTTTATLTSAPGAYAIVPTASGTNLAQYQVSVANGTLTISKASVTATLALSATSVMQGQNLTVTAQVASATSGTPTGTVSFFSNGNPLGTATLTGGTATYSTTTLPPGTNAITASYGGDSNFTAATASAVSVTVGSNVLNVTAKDASRMYGAPNPTFTGSITGAQNGDTFTESFTTTATLTSAPGTYSIVPSASGTNLAQYQVSVTNGKLTVTKASVTSTIALSAASVTQGQNVTVTATVASTTTGTPTGTVSFFNNGNALGTATLTNGTVTYSTTTLPIGSNVITFTYGGDTNFNTVGSTTGANTVTVSAPIPLDFDFQMTTPSSGLTGNYGKSVKVTLHVAPTAGQYPGTVQFAVSGTPAVPATYTFSPATVAADAGATDVTMTIQLQALANLNHGPATSGRLASIALGLLVLPWVSVRRMRRSGQRLRKSLGLSALLLVALGAALSVTGCGSGTPKTANIPVSDSIVVNATSGSVQHSVTVNLQVLKAQ